MSKLQGTPLSNWPKLRFPGRGKGRRRPPRLHKHSWPTQAWLEALRASQSPAWTSL